MDDDDPAVGVVCLWSRRSYSDVFDNQGRLVRRKSEKGIRIVVDSDPFLLRGFETLVSLKILHLALVLLGVFSRLESSYILSRVSCPLRLDHLTPSTTLVTISQGPRSSFRYPFPSRHQVASGRRGSWYGHRFLRRPTA